MPNYSNIFDNQALDYISYREKVSSLLLQGETTGSDHSEAMLHYTKMNVQRMNRVDKTTILHEPLLQVIANLKAKYKFDQIIFKLLKNSLSRR